MVRGGDFAHWDLEVRAGVLTGVRLRMAIEEHGAGKQFLRFRMWPKWSKPWLIASAVFATISVFALLDQAWTVSATLGLMSLLVLGRMCLGCATAMAVTRQVLLEARATEEKVAPSVVPVAPSLSQALIEGNGNPASARNYPQRKINYVAHEAHGNGNNKSSIDKQSEVQRLKARKASAS